MCWVSYHLIFWYFYRIADSNTVAPSAGNDAIWNFLKAPIFKILLEYTTRLKTEYKPLVPVITNKEAEPCHPCYLIFIFPPSLE